MGGADGGLLEKWAEAGPSSEMFSGLGKVTQVPEVAACTQLPWGSANDYGLETPGCLSTGVGFGSAGVLVSFIRYSNENNQHGS